MLSKLFKKNSLEPTNDFLEIMGGSSPRVGQDKVRAMVEAYMACYGSLSAEELVAKPIRDKVEAFLAYVVPVVCEMCHVGEVDAEYVRCVASASVFVPEGQNWNKRLVPLVFALASSKLSGYA